VYRLVILWGYQMGSDEQKWNVIFQCDDMIYYWFAYNSDERRESKFIIKL